MRLGQKLKGACLCGAVEIELTQDRSGVHVCHCSMCQKWSGGPFLSLQGVKPEAMTIQGRDSISVFRSSDWAERAFCSKCGSNLWYSFLPLGHTSFLAGLFELPADYQVTEEIFIDEKPAYYDLAGNAPRKTGAEVIAEATEAGIDF